MTSMNSEAQLPGPKDSSLLKKMLTGVGFMADTYDLFVINMVVDIMKDIYTVSELDETLIKTSALIGAVVGQVLFGYFADKLGRTSIFLSTCLLTIIGSLSSAVVGDAGTFTICQWLILTRFFLGVGVGGEYPLSATITAENSRGLTESEMIKNLCITFSMQGVGQILCGICLVLLTQFVEDEDLQWRLALAFGAIPMILSFYYRWKMHSNKTTDPLTPNANNQTTLSSPLLETEDSEVTKLSILECVKQNWIQLLGCAGSWFLLDIVFYGNGLFSASITEAMGTADGNKAKAVQVLILQFISLPGYFVAAYLMPIQGCKYVQNLGFLATIIIFSLMAIFQPYLKQVGPLYIILYGLTFFFENYGANTSTYVIPAITFPTNSRATCHGISAASGKLGAIFGVFVLLYLKNSFCHGECDDDEPNNTDRGLQLTFGFCALIGVVGYVWSYKLVSDDMDNSLKSCPDAIIA